MFEGGWTYEGKVDIGGGGGGGGTGDVYSLSFGWVIESETFFSALISVVCDCELLIKRDGFSSDGVLPGGGGCGIVGTGIEGFTKGCIKFPNEL